MSDWTKYQRKGLSEMRPYVEGEDTSKVSISEPDKQSGSPKSGDMIARNPKNHADQWLVAKTYFEENLEPAVNGGGVDDWKRTADGNPPDAGTVEVYNKAWSIDPICLGYYENTIWHTLDGMSFALESDMPDNHPPTHWRKVVGPKE